MAPALCVVNLGKSSAEGGPPLQALRARDNMYPAGRMAVVFI